MAYPIYDDEEDPDFVPPPQVPGPPFTPGNPPQPGGDFPVVQPDEPAPSGGAPSWHMGSPGSATEAINRNNPHGDASLPYVQDGDTGGYLQGVGITVGEGRSITPEQAAAQRQAALDSGIPQSFIDRFLGENPMDTNRLIEAYNSHGGADARGGGAGGGRGFGGLWTPPGFNTPTFNAPRPFSYGAFQAPDRNAVLQDPGYQFRVDEGERARKNFASAEGMYRTPGTLQDLMQWREGLASQEYGQVYGRRLGEWDRGYGAESQRFERDYRGNLNDYNMAYQREGDTFNRALAEAGMNLDIESSRNGNLLSLYGMSQRNMPQYEPVPLPDWSIG